MDAGLQPINHYLKYDWRAAYITVLDILLFSDTGVDFTEDFLATIGAANRYIFTQIKSHFSVIKSNNNSFKYCLPDSVGLIHVALRSISAFSSANRRPVSATLIGKPVCR